MNICLICDATRSGPIPAYLLELSKEFVKKGHKVTMLSKKDLSLPDYEEKGGIKYFRFGVIPVLPLPWSYPSAIWSVDKSVGQPFGKERYAGVQTLGISIPKRTIYSISVLMKTIEIHREIEIIHCFDPFVLLFQTTPKILLNKHVVVTVNHLSKRLYWRLLSLADHVITPSQYAKRRISADNRIREEKIEVIYNGVNIDRFSPKISGDEVRHIYGLEDSPLILFVGRVCPEKGVDYLLKSIPLVKEQIPDVNVMIVGPLAPARLFHEREDYMRYLNNLVKKLDLTNVTFTGAVDFFNELPKFYAACNVFTCPTIWDEAFGLVSVEAMASGKPVVATRSGGLPEIVKDGEVGYIVPKMREKELAKALIKILEDEGLQRRMGKAARRRVETRFSWDTIANKYLKLYRKVIND